MRSHSWASGFVVRTNEKLLTVATSEKIEDSSFFSTKNNSTSDFRSLRIKKHWKSLPFQLFYIINPAEHSLSTRDRDLWVIRFEPRHMEIIEIDSL